MNQYYEILGLPILENDQNVILKAYREATLKIVQSSVGQYIKVDKLISINEAYLVLSDLQLKKKYDCLLEIQFFRIMDEIKAKKEQAKQFVLSIEKERHNEIMRLKRQMDMEYRTKDDNPNFAAGVFAGALFCLVLYLIMQLIFK